MIIALEEIQLKNISFKNRAIRSATMDPLGKLDYIVSLDQLNLYKISASNNVVLLSGAKFLFHLLKNEVNTKRVYMVYNNSFIDSHGKLYLYA